MKEYRLTQKTDIQSVFSQSAKITHKSLLALYCPNTHQHPRLGMVITKNRLSHAVDRNYTKRLIREGFRQHFEQLSAFDILILLRGKPTLENLSHEVSKLWNLLTKLT